MDGAVRLLLGDHGYLLSRFAVVTLFLLLGAHGAEEKVLKWVVVIVVLVLVTGLFRPALSRTMRLGRLPGDLHFTFRGRPYYFPFASTVLLSLIAWVILRLV